MWQETVTRTKRARMLLLRWKKPSAKTLMPPVPLPCLADDWPRVSVSRRGRAYSCCPALIIPLHQVICRPSSVCRLLPPSTDVSRNSVMCLTLRLTEHWKSLPRQQRFLPRQEKPAVTTARLWASSMYPRCWNNLNVFMWNVWSATVLRTRAYIMMS